MPKALNASYSDSTFFSLPNCIKLSHLSTKGILIIDVITGFFLVSGRPIPRKNPLVFIVLLLSLVFTRILGLLPASRET